MGKQINRKHLVEGYRTSAERNREIAEEFQHVSIEANQYLGPVPNWNEEMVESIDSDCDDVTETRE